MRSVFLFLVLTTLTSGQPAGMRLVWSDEFAKSGGPDPSKWTYEQGLVRNREAQFYTAGRPENARVENGLLIIEARKEAWAEGGKEAAYTSASLTTEGKASWNHGRVEVRAKLPTGRGVWPAIWMLGNNQGSVGWPQCGEIDIMENVGFDPDVIHANIHTKAYNHAKQTNKGGKITIPSPHRDFHVYAVEWDQQKMDFFVDGKLYFTYRNEGTGDAVWPFDKPHYLILNLAVGGTWGGREGIDDSIFPQRLEIDYVRVYQP